MREQLKQMLIRHEGIRLYIYEDTVGIPTIGVGRNLADKGLSDQELQYLGLGHIKQLKTITKEQAMYLLDNDIDDVFRELKQYLPWIQDQPDTVKLVLSDMCFNLGIKGLLKFKNTLRMIREGNYKEASENMLYSKWARQVKGRAIELSNMLKSL